MGEKVKVDLHINNLGERDSISNLNQSLSQFIKGNNLMDSLSEESVRRIEQGNAIRLLDSKSLKD